VWTQHPDRCERHLARGECIEDGRETPAHSRDHDAAASGVLGQSKHARAIGEEGAVTLRSVERRPRVEYGEVRHEFGRRLAFGNGEPFDAREEIVIGEFRGESEDVRVHALCVSR
jgi:hypothetical protein